MTTPPPPSNLEKLALLAGQLEERDKAIRILSEDMWDYFENNTIPMHQVNSEGVIQRANKAELSFLGYTEDEYVGHHPEEFYPDKECLQYILDKLAVGETIWQLPVKIRHKKGHLVYGHLTSSVGPKGLTRCLTMPRDEPSSP